MSHTTWDKATKRSVHKPVPRIKGKCPTCGTRFEGISTRRFCSDKCRVRAHRAAEKSRSSK